MKASEKFRRGRAPRCGWLCGLLFVGCHSSFAPTDAGPDAAPCLAVSDRESACHDGLDDDCDGLIDCGDLECEGSHDAECFCGMGTCLAPCVGDDCLTPLPPIENLRVDMRGDTAVVSFEPVAGAVDYRIYPSPDPSAVRRDESGRLVVENAIYRCAGSKVHPDREHDPLLFDYDTALRGSHDGYDRTEQESLLGYVYLTAGPGRSPVYRVADPNGNGGYGNAHWMAPPYADANRADYLTDRASQDNLLASGWRDDGVAFYVPDDGARTLYRAEYAPAMYELAPATRFFVDGAEADYRRSGSSEPLSLEPRFRVHAFPDAQTVPLHRVSYGGSTRFDGLAAGDAQLQRVLHQTGPVETVSWPGLTETTTLIVEALDAGCPFPGGFIAPEAHEADVEIAGGEGRGPPSITLDDARLATGEVFVNGQHDPLSRPRAIARAAVVATPEPADDLAFLETFSDVDRWTGFERFFDNYSASFRNPYWAVDTTGCAPHFTFGPVLGQLLVGHADWGSICNVSISPRDVETHLRADRFLHVRMSTALPSTWRRYPQILITTAPLVEPGDVATASEIPVHTRLGPLFDEPRPEDQVQSIIVQPFGGNHQLQVQHCDRRGWGASAQCPQANLYGHHAGSYTEPWSEPWTPVPVLGELVGFDRPVRLDVFASTERVYVYVEGRPAGCADLPTGRVPEGSVTVAFRTVVYHADIDEAIVPADSGRTYERTYQLLHAVRSFDDFGIDHDVPAPAWDESVRPCGTRWY